jgi:hypothetical protein
LAHKFYYTALFVSCALAMKIPRFRIVLTLGAICLMVASVCLLWVRDPCARLKYLARSAGRLGLSYPRHYRLSDHVVRILHQKEPFDYYCTELHKEEERLLATGDLVETPIGIATNRTDRDVTLALHAVCERTGAYCSHSIDVTNHSLLLITRPQDIAVFSAAIR